MRHFVCYRDSSYALAHSVGLCDFDNSNKKSVRSKCDNCHTQYTWVISGMRHDGRFFHIPFRFFFYQSHFNLGESCEGYPKNIVCKHTTWYGLPFITQTLNKQERLIIHFNIWPHMHLNLNWISDGYIFHSYFRCIPRWHAICRYCSLFGFGRFRNSGLKTDTYIYLSVRRKWFGFNGSI